MKDLLSIILPVLFIISSQACSRSGNQNFNKESEEIFAQLDQEIELIPEYQQEKEIRIKALTKQFNKEEDEIRKSGIGKIIIDEYESFISDSALHYINLLLQMPLTTDDKEETVKLLIKKADIEAHAGLFKESQNLLLSINPDFLSNVLKQEYYSAYCDLYQYMTEYTTDGEFVHENEIKRKQYIDSLTAISSHESIIHIINKAAEEARQGNTGKAEEMLLNKINDFKPGDRNFSIIASILAYVYKITGETDKYKNYLIQTAISDIKGNIKENMAIRELATVCYEEGDIERADKYLRQSFADANFYSARMRNAQSSRMLPIIGEAFSTHQKKLNKELRLFVIFISILALGFILISIFALFQVRKVRKAKKKTDEMLGEVSSLSEKLSEMNKELTQNNKELATSNALRGQYAVLFMEYCSMAITALQSYQQTLRVAANQGNLPALIKKIDSATVETKTLAEFYSKFDEAILKIYPHFVENFNSLLKPESRIEIKPKENLTTELRIFALIKIGITDSEKIAKFLRCSLTTVYTYRSKTKKKALNPDSFDDEFANI